MSALAIAELSQATIEGTGTFDVLMRAIKAHLEQEFIKGRIKGPEYSTVYLGSLELAMRQGLDFLLQQRKNDLEAQLLEKQILHVEAQILHVEAQTELANQQKTNLIAEALNIPKQGEVLDAQKLKVDAEVDLTEAQTTRTAEETLLLTQKIATERAQILAAGVDADSVVGKQKLLYAAQTTGFTRDAEQKAAKLMADTWSVRRTTDEATVADATNLLNDASVGRAITKLLNGIGA